MNAPNVRPSPRNAKISVEVQKTPSTIEIVAVDHLAGWRLAFSQGPVSVVKDEKITLQTVLGGIATFLAGLAGFEGMSDEGSVTDHIEAAAEDLVEAPPPPAPGSVEALKEEIELAGKHNETLRAENEALKAGADPTVRAALAAAEAKAAELEAEVAALKAAVPPVPPPVSPDGN